MDNKTKILETALELFSLKGYDGTGIQEIADRADIGKPTMYYYFGNKEGLLLAICEKYFNELLDTLEQAAAYAHDITKTLTEITTNHFQYAIGNQTFFRMMLSMSVEPKETVAYKILSPYVKKEFSLVTAMFKAAEEDHGNMKGRSLFYTVSFLGMVNTYITLLLNEDITMSDDLIYRIVHQFMYGIFS